MGNQVLAGGSEWYGRRSTDKGTRDNWAAVWAPDVGSLHPGAGAGPPPGMAIRHLKAVRELG